VALADRQAYLQRYSESDKRKPLSAEVWQTPYWHIDTAFAAMLMLLTATDDGLGALFFSVADIPAFRVAFDVPERMHPIGTLAIGYPLPERQSSSLARGRRPEAEIIHRGRWQG
jgi:nitroreductase